MGRDDALSDLNDKVASGHSVCLVGASGMGKSALWCSAVTALGDRTHAVLVVGVAPGTSGLRDRIGHLAGQVGLVPPDGVPLDDLVRWWRLAVSDLGDLLIAIDGLDGLDADKEICAGSRDCRSPCSC